MQERKENFSDVNSSEKHIKLEPLLVVVGEDLGVEQVQKAQQAAKSEGELCYAVGCLYHQQQIPQYQHALRWFTMGAKHNARCAHMLGDYYAQGWGVEKDVSQAANFYADACLIKEDRLGTAEIEQCLKCLRTWEKQPRTQVAACYALCKIYSADKDTIKWAPKYLAKIKDYYSERTRLLMAIKALSDAYLQHNCAVELQEVGKEIIALGEEFFEENYIFNFVQINDVTAAYKLAMQYVRKRRYFEESSATDLAMSVK